MAWTKFAPWLLAATLLLVPENPAGPAAAAGPGEEPALRLHGYLEETLYARSFSSLSQYGLRSHLRLKVDLPIQEGVSARGEFDLEAEGADSTAENTASAGIDRLYLRLADGDTQVTIGRQRISWGNGAAFAPADFFNPPNPLDPAGPRPGADGVLVRQALGELSYAAVAAAFVDPGDSLVTVPREMSGSLRLGTHAGSTDLDVGLGYDGVAGRTVTFLEARGDLGVGWHGSLAYLDKDGSGRWAGAAGVDYSFLGGEVIGTLEYAAGPAPGDSQELPRWAVGATYAPSELTSYQVNLLLDTDPKAKPYASAGLTQILSDSLDLSARLTAAWGAARTPEDTLRGVGEVKLRYSF